MQCGAGGRRGGESQLGLEAGEGEIAADHQI